MGIDHGYSAGRSSNLLQKTKKLFHLSGVDGEQEEESGEVFAAEVRGRGPDYDHDYKLDPGKGEEC